MFTTNDKETLRQEIKADIMYPNIDLNHGSSPRDEIARAIQNCVESAIDALIDKLYTTEQFEKDLGIR